MPLIDAPVRKAFFWPCVVGVLIAIGCDHLFLERTPGLEGERVREREREPEPEPERDAQSAFLGE